MRDRKSGYKMSYALLCTVILLAIAAAFLLFQSIGDIVNGCMIVISLAAMLIAYNKSAKQGVYLSGALMGTLAVLTLLFWPNELIAFIFWVVWMPLNLYCVSRMRSGVAGIETERDFYRRECERIAMTDAITQMRNRHAFLNDAPIYIKIASRYDLDMMALVFKLTNIDELREKLGKEMFNEMLETISRMIHNTVRLEDLAYLIDNQHGIWCISMFTHPEAIDIVTKRLRKGLDELSIKQGDGTPCELHFACGYASYAKDEDPTPSALLRRATDMADGTHDI